MSKILYIVVTSILAFSLLSYSQVNGSESQVNGSESQVNGSESQENDSGSQKNDSENIRQRNINNARLIVQNITLAVQQYSRKLENVKSTNDLLAAIDEFTKAILDVNKKVNELNLNNVNDNFSDFLYQENIEELKEDFNKLRNAFKMMSKAAKKPNVMKHYNEANVQKAVKKLQYVMKWLLAKNKK